MSIRSCFLSRRLIAVTACFLMTSSNVVIGQDEVTLMGWWELSETSDVDIVVAE